MLLPLVSIAQTADQGELIRQLTQQAAKLQAQLDQLRQTTPPASSLPGLSQQLEESKKTFLEKLLQSKKYPVNSVLPAGDQPEDEGTAAPTTFDRNLYLGLRNDADVSNLQEFLTDQGFYNQTISGNFFILTRNAVKKFQQAHGIKPSGYFGSLTRTVANKILTGEEVPPVTPPLFPVSTGHLTIDPAYATVKIGETQRIRAIFTPVRLPCLDDVIRPCKVPERVPYEVSASFESSNPSVATVGGITCAAVKGIPCPSYYFVRGVSEGGAVITASYTDGSGGGYTAQMKVSVSNGATSQLLTLTAPNGGEQWQLNSLHTITWAPYDPNSGVNPAKEVTAYLEQLVGGQYIVVGKIIESGKASIHWIGEIDQYGKYPQPGSYYIRIVNNRTGESDRSDAPFTLVPAGTLTADLKVNGSDGPITIPAGGADYKVSWQSTASSCSIYNNAASDSGGAQLNNLLPTGSQVMHFAENTQAYAQYISLECLSKSPIEGSASDNVQLLPSAAPLTIFSPNGGENIDLSQSYVISWKTTADVTKASIALYKNDKWFAWIAPSVSVNYGSGGSYTWTPTQTISRPDIGNNVFKIYMIGYKTSGGTVEDKSDAPFSIVSQSATLDTDLRVTSITKETFHPYAFNGTFCVDGNQSINDLKKTNPGLTGFPFDYAVYDLRGNKYQRQTGVSGTPEDLKNGQCSTFGWSIQQQEQGYYDQSKKVELILDPANLVAETNESNNSLVFIEPQPQPFITVLSPNGGEQYQAGQSVQMSLQWSASCVIGAFTIELYKSGSFVQMINGNIPAGICSGSQQTTPYYTTWQTPLTLSAGGDYKVRVSKNASKGVSAIFDDSDAPFSISQP